MLYYKDLIKYKVLRKKEELKIYSEEEYYIEIICKLYDEFTYIYATRDRLYRMDIYKKIFLGQKIEENEEFFIFEKWFIFNKKTWKFVKGLSVVRDINTLEVFIIPREDLYPNTDSIELLWEKTFSHFKKWINLSVREKYIQFPNSDIYKFYKERGGFIHILTEKYLPKEHFYLSTKGSWQVRFSDKLMYLEEKEIFFKEIPYIRKELEKKISLAWEFSEELEEDSIEEYLEIENNARKEIEKEYINELEEKYWRFMWGYNWVWIFKEKILVFSGVEEVWRYREKNYPKDVVKFYIYKTNSWDNKIVGFTKRGDVILIDECWDLFYWWVNMRHIWKGLFYNEQTWEYYVIKWRSLNKDIRWEYINIPEDIQENFSILNEYKEI